MSQRLDKIAAHYLSAGVFSAFAGLLSYGLLTRVLSPDHYGQLGLISSAIAFVVSCSKLGLQHAIVRFFCFPERLAEGLSVQTLQKTIQVLTIFLMLLSVCLVWLFYFFYQDELDQLSTSLLFVLTLSAALRVLISTWMNRCRALEQSSIIAKAQFIERSLRIIILLVGYFSGFISVFYALLAALVGEILQSLIYFVWLSKFSQKESHAVAESQGQFDRQIVASLLLFSLPLMAKEMLHLVLEMGDRFIINAYMGSAAVGQYAALYNLCLYVDWTVISAMAAALIPRVVTLYENQQTQRMADLVQALTHAYLLFSMMVVSGALLLGPVVVSLLAGDYYSQYPAYLLEMILMGILINGSMHIATLNLFLKKRANHLFFINGIAAALNVGLNFLMIPEFGLMGAAFSTVLSYSVSFLLAQYASDQPGFLRQLSDKKTWSFIGLSVILVFVFNMYSESVLGRLLGFIVILITLFWPMKKWAKSLK